MDSDRSTQFVFCIVQYEVAHVAKICMEYVSSGTVADTSTPPAPVNVRVEADANHGNEIKWDT
jgi:hypothetical protein